MKNYRLLIIIAMALLVGSALGTIGLLWYAAQDPVLLKDFVKSLFDKLLLSGVVASLAVLAGLWLEDIKVRRTFFINQQSNAARSVMERANSLTNAVGDWFIDYTGEAHKPRVLQETSSFGQVIGDNIFALPPEFLAVLDEFHRLMIEVHSFCLTGERTGSWAEPRLLAHDCAEFAMVLKQSLAIEYQRAIGMSDATPVVDLRGKHRKSYPERVIDWGMVQRL